MGGQQSHAESQVQMRPKSANNLALPADQMNRLSKGTEGGVSQKSLIQNDVMDVSMLLGSSKQRERIWNYSFSQPKDEESLTNGFHSDVNQNQREDLRMAEVPLKEQINPIFDGNYNGAPNGQLNRDSEAEFFRDKEDGHERTMATEIFYKAPQQLVPQVVKDFVVDGNMRQVMNAVLQRILHKAVDEGSEVDLLRRLLTASSQELHQLETDYGQVGLLFLAKWVHEIHFHKPAMQHDQVNDIVEFVNLQLQACGENIFVRSSFDVALLPVRVRSVYQDWYKDNVQAFLNHTSSEVDYTNMDDIINDFFTVMHLCKQLLSKEQAETSGNTQHNLDEADLPEPDYPTDDPEVTYVKVNKNRSTLLQDTGSLTKGPNDTSRVNLWDIGVDPDELVQAEEEQPEEHPAFQVPINDQYRVQPFEDKEPMDQSKYEILNDVQNINQPMDQTSTQGPRREQVPAQAQPINQTSTQGQRKEQVPAQAQPMDQTSTQGHRREQVPAQTQPMDQILNEANMLDDTEQYTIRQPLVPSISVVTEEHTTQQCLVPSNNVGTEEYSNQQCVVPSINVETREKHKKTAPPVPKKKPKIAVPNYVAPREILKSNEDNKHEDASQDKLSHSPTARVMVTESNHDYARHIPTAQVTPDNRNSMVVLTPEVEPSITQIHDDVGVLEERATRGHAEDTGSYDLDQMVYTSQSDMAMSNGESEHYQQNGHSKHVNQASRHQNGYDAEDSSSVIIFPEKVQLISIGDYHFDDTANHTFAGSHSLNSSSTTGQYSPRSAEIYQTSHHLNQFNSNLPMQTNGKLDATAPSQRPHFQTILTTDQGHFHELGQPQGHFNQMHKHYQNQGYYQGQGFYQGHIPYASYAQPSGHLLSSQGHLPGYMASTVDPLLQGRYVSASLFVHDNAVNKMPMVGSLPITIRGKPKRAPSVESLEKSIIID